MAANGKFCIPHYFEPTEPLKHDHTPTKAAVLSTISYLEDHHLPFEKRDIFRYFDVPKRTGFRWTAKNEPRRLHNRPDLGPDPRGRKRKLTRDDLRKNGRFFVRWISMQSPQLATTCNSSWNTRSQRPYHSSIYARS